MEILKGNIPPSLYGWLIPTLKPLATIDQLAAKGEFPSMLDLAPALIYCVAFGLARLVLTRIAFKPLALFSMRLNINTSIKPIPAVDKYISQNLYYTTDSATTDKDAKREKAKKKSKKDVDTLVTEILKSSGISKQDLGEKDSPAALGLYIKATRRNAALDIKVVKFVEALWRGIFYAVFVGLGLVSLFNPTQEWVLDTTKHWAAWPQPVKPIVMLYYHLALGCYLHQLMWTEVTRSDAVEMILHHLTTILLIMLSFLTQFTRIGASILLVHDIADVFLESAKCFNYTAQNNARCKSWATPLCDILFACFAVSFFITRLIIYPRFLVFSLVVEAPRMLGGLWTGYYVFAGLLCTLQLLHVFWFALISKMIYKMFTEGIKKDERSDDEEEEEEDEGKERRKQS